jgi:hypothetical protein
LIRSLAVYLLNPHCYYWHCLCYSYFTQRPSAKIDLQKGPDLLVLLHLHRRVLQTFLASSIQQFSLGRLELQTLLALLIGCQTCPTSIIQLVSLLLHRLSCHRRHRHLQGLLIILRDFRTYS